MLYGDFMLIALIIFLIVVFDQISKYYADLLLKGAESVSVVPGLFSFHYHENKGAAWGLLADHRWVFMIISTIAILGITFYLIYSRKEKNPLIFRLSLAFFVGGGIGNMIDRIILGYVIDFIQFDFIDFPIFNIADSFITIGAFLMIVHLILESISEFRSKKNV